MSIQYSGNAQTSTFTPTTKQNIIDGVETALLAAGWTTISGHATTNLLMQSATTAQGYGICVRLKDNGGTSVQFSIQSTDGAVVGTNTSSAMGGNLNPNSGGWVYRVVACKYQAFVFASPYPGTGRSYVGFGVPYVPSHLISSITRVGWLQGNTADDGSNSVLDSLRTGISPNGNNAIASTQVILNATTWTYNTGQAPQGGISLAGMVSFWVVSYFAWALAIAVCLVLHFNFFTFGQFRANWKDVHLVLTAHGQIPKSLRFFWPDIGHKRNMAIYRELEDVRSILGSHRNIHAKANKKMVVREIRQTRHRLFNLRARNEGYYVACGVLLPFVAIRSLAADRNTYLLNSDRIGRLIGYPEPNFDCSRQAITLNNNRVPAFSSRQLYVDPLLQSRFLDADAVSRSLGGVVSLIRLPRNSYKGQDDSPCCRPVWPSKKAIPTWGVPCGIVYVLLGMLFTRLSGDSRFMKLCGLLCGLLGGAFILTGYEECHSNNYNPSSNQSFQHNLQIVPQKLLTSLNYWGTLNTAEGNMANVLNTDKQIAIVSALSEGSSIRSIERMTGIHRDTIMRLGVKVGQGCTALMDSTMRDLPCTRLEMDEIWGFIGKKEKHVKPEDDSSLGSVWTFCAIDAETKLVPAFCVGKRDAATANAFVADVASRMRTKVQISTDGLRAYVEAIEKSFGGDVDYAQIIKTYGSETGSDHRRYSQPEFVSAEKKVICGSPNIDLISTSYIERLNATTRLHVRRLTRLTLAFSKKRENFTAAVGLHFAYYNFVKRHNTLRCTPAMAAGVTGTMWSVCDLLEAAA